MIGNQLLIGSVVNFANNHLLQEKSPRIESLPDFPVIAIEQSLQDALTAVICHKAVGGGEARIVSLNPVFSFAKHTGEGGHSYISGDQITKFVEKCIDTIVLSPLEQVFDYDDGRKVISVLDLQPMYESNDSITFKLEFILNNEQSPFSMNGVEDSGPGIVWQTCNNSSAEWDVTSHVHRWMLSNSLNDPYCNIYLRFRQRSSFPLSDNSIHPPHPSSYGGMLMPGFVWRLSYQGIIRNTYTSPNSFGLYYSFYTSYGNYNFWNNLNMPSLLNGSQLDNVARGIIYQGTNPQFFSYVNSYWDIMGIDLGNSYYSGIFAGGGIGDAIQVQYTWSKWSWIAIPDPNYWVSINYDEGITELLNP